MEFYVYLIGVITFISVMGLLLLAGKVNDIEATTRQNVSALKVSLESAWHVVNRAEEERKAIETTDKTKCSVTEKILFSHITELKTADDDIYKKLIPIGRELDVLAARQRAMSRTTHVYMHEAPQKKRGKAVEQ